MTAQTTPIAPFSNPLGEQDQKLWEILTNPDYDDYGALEDEPEPYSEFRDSMAPEFDVQVSQVVRMISEYFVEQVPHATNLTASLPLSPEADEMTNMLQVECSVDVTRNQWLGEAKRIQDWTDAATAEGPEQALAIARVVFEVAQRLVAAVQTLKAS